MLIAFALAALCFAAVPAVLVCRNLAAIRQPEPPPGSVRGVSVLIPARNEEGNIGEAVDTVLASRNADLEVIVLDDASSDGTAATVTERARRDGRLRLLQRNTVPAGQCGKPSACQALANAAAGDVLVFMDADVRLAPFAVSALTSTLRNGRAALISGIPLQETGTLIERLVVPLMHFVLYGFLPVRMMRSSVEPAFGTACGQLIAVTRAAYQSVGGHASVADRVHDGLALARRFRRLGFQTDLIDPTSLARCRMYTTWQALIDGFAKNAHEGLGSPAGIVPWTLVLGLGQIAPFVLVSASWHAPITLTIAGTAASVALATRALLAIRLKQSWIGVALHPVGVAILIGIQWYALLRRMLHRPVSWKGRPVTSG